METFLSGLALATLSAITYLAYRHPNAYGKIDTWLFSFLIFVFSGFGGWEIAVTRTFASLSSQLQIDKFDEARSVIEALRIPAWMFFAPLGVSLYLMFLSVLPNILKENNSKNPKGDQEKN